MIHCSINCLTFAWSIVLASLEAGKDFDMAAIGQARAIFGQSSPHLKDVRLDGVFSVSYAGFPHIFYY